MVEPSGSPRSKPWKKGCSPRMDLACLGHIHKTRCNSPAIAKIEPGPSGLHTSVFEIPRSRRHSEDAPVPSNGRVLRPTTGLIRSAILLDIVSHRPTHNDRLDLRRIVATHKGRAGKSENRHRRRITARLPKRHTRSQRQGQRVFTAGFQNTRYRLRKEPRLQVPSFQRIPVNRNRLMSVQ